MPVPRHKNLQIGRELIQRLTACTAGIRRRTACSDGDLREFTISLADRLHQRSALGAERVAVGGIFDVAAGENMSVFGFQSRTDRIAGIRHIGVLSGFDCHFKQSFVCHPVYSSLVSPMDARDFSSIARMTGLSSSVIWS